MMFPQNAVLVSSLSKVLLFRDRVNILNNIGRIIDCLLATEVTFKGTEESLRQAVFKLYVNKIFVSFVR